MKLKLLSTTAALMLTGAAAQAAPMTVFAGDADCFGLGGACAAGDLWRDGLGGTFFTDYSSAGDPAGTDHWDTHGSLSFNLALGAGAASAVSASLTIFFAGLELGTGADVMVNGTSVGSIQALGQNDFQLVDLASFGGIESLLTSNTTVSINPSSGSDGYIVDYASITYDTAVVPLPAALPLLLAGLGGLGVMRRRRKAA